jgi:dihydroorotase
MNILFRNGRIIDPVTGFDSTADLLVVDGTISAIGKSLNPVSGTTVVDCTGKIIAPGFIDMHVHLREPGFEHKETIETGTASAAAGGFTAVCCMPNTNPAIDEASVVRSVIEKASAVNGGIVDVYPVAAVTKGRQGKELSPMLELAEAGAVGFSDDGSPVAEPDTMRRAMEYAGMAGMPVIQHAEEPRLTKGGAMNEGAVSTLLGMPGIPPEAETMIVARDLLIAAAAGGHYHLTHASTAGSIEAIRAAKAKGLPVTCDVTPHHFSLTDEAVRSFDTNTKMNPPLRTPADVEAIKAGLKDGTIDAIATDHAPHSFDEKQVEYVYAPFGIVGFETALGLAIRELVVPGIISITELIRKFSTNPRAILKLTPIRFEKGEKAVLTIFDPDCEWVVDVNVFKSKSKNSPFHGWKLKGKAVGIYNHGKYLAVNGE